MHIILNYLIYHFGNKMRILDFRVYLNQYVFHYGLFELANIFVINHIEKQNIFLIILFSLL